MSTSGRPEVRPITTADAPRAAAFLHEQLNPRVSAEQWSRLLLPPWGDDTAPNRGFQLVDEERIVGVYAAVYARRTLDGSERDVCNLAAFCVLEEHRAHSVRLVRALLAQRGYVFTDFSPSGNVVAMNERLGFRRLDTAARLVANVPAVSRGTMRVTEEPRDLAATLQGAEAVAYRDHREAPAARHLLVDDGENYAYLVYRRERRKRLPLFAVPLHVGGDRQLLLSAWPQVGAHLLRRGFPLTLAERRVLGFAPPGPGRFVENRPKMVRSKEVDAAGIDYLYSELALVEW
ncbi:hypothetical protein [Leifsonia sp. AG29]|uniref:hypothetical protein n=1 Tax=Leifsonia sp. AG29 TaxID=2598860 RepID=UPI00131E221A|nr:hypothetical protein [Leifsonia sp. AG29]